MGRFLRVGFEADAEPRASRARLPEIMRAAQTPCAGSRSDRSLQKGGFAAKLDTVKARLACGTPIEVWFQDEARVGQKNKITRRWAKRGTRPSAPHDQRTKSAYIFGAICPQEDKAAGLVLPFCNTDTMNLHLAEIPCTSPQAPTPWC